MKVTVILVAIIIATAVLIFALPSIGATPQAGQVIVGSAGGILAIYHDISRTLEERKKTQKERIAELIQNNFYMPPIIVLFSVVGYFMFVEVVMSFLTGFAIGFALGDNVSFQIALLISTWTALLFLIYAAVPIAKYATHRIKKAQLGWVIFSTAAFIVIDTALGMILTKTTQISVMFLVIRFVSLLPGVFIGYKLAKREHSRYIMSHLFKQLSNSDQQSFIELAQTLPSASTA